MSDYGCNATLGVGPRTCKFTRQTTEVRGQFLKPLASARKLKLTCEGWICECSQVKIYKGSRTLCKFSLASTVVAKGTTCSMFKKLAPGQSNNFPQSFPPTVGIIAESATETQNAVILGRHDLWSKTLTHNSHHKGLHQLRIQQIGHQREEMEKRKKDGVNVLSSETIPQN